MTRIHYAAWSRRLRAVHLFTTKALCGQLRLQRATNNWKLVTCQRCLRERPNKGRP